MLLHKKFHHVNHLGAVALHLDDVLLPLDGAVGQLTVDALVERKVVADILTLLLVETNLARELVRKLFRGAVSVAKQHFRPVVQKVHVDGLLSIDLHALAEGLVPSPALEGKLFALLEGVITATAPGRLQGRDQVAGGAKESPLLIAEEEEEEEEAIKALSRAVRLIDLAVGAQWTSAGAAVAGKAAGAGERDLAAAGTARAAQRRKADISRSCGIALLKKNAR